MTDPHTLANDVRDRVLEVLGSPDNYVPLHEPEFTGREEALVVECIRSGWVSSVGQYVDQFEKDIAAATDTEFGVAVVNGTAALEVALHVVGVSAGDEVLMPSLTFIATANAAHHLGAIPHFVDCDNRTLGIDPAALRRHLLDIVEMREGYAHNKNTGRRLAAVLPMHVFGHPVDMVALGKVASEFELVVVEDAAEALGSKLNNKRCGSWGLVGALSFNGNKILTTGGGGAIVTNDANIASLAKHLTTTAKVQHPWSFMHDAIGYNYRMPNINAALGVAQLEQLDKRVLKKRALALAYQEAFSGHPDIKVFVEQSNACSNYWLNALILEPHAASARDTLLRVLNEAGIMSRPVWEPLHTQTMYSEVPRASLPATENIASRIINIPSSANLLRYFL